MLIKIIDITDDWVSGLGGLRVGRYIEQYINTNNQNEQLELSFYEIDIITPSFVNGAFLYIIDLYGYEMLKQNVKIKNIKANLGAILKEQIQSYVEHISKQ